MNRPATPSAANTTLPWRLPKRMRGPYATCLLPSVIRHTAARLSGIVRAPAGDAGRAAEIAASPANLGARLARACVAAPRHLSQGPHSPGDQQGKGRPDAERDTD